MDSESLSARSNSKHRVILRDVRQRIVDGTFPPGGRIPTRRELMNEFDAGPVTAHRALAQLLRGGFLIARGALGTFVAPTPPHLCRYAMVFHGFPGKSLYLQSLLEASRQLDGGEQRRMVPYFGLDGHADVEDFQRLTREVVNHQVAGVN